MYNGIGLTTARGSGTNGYVQRNLSSLTVNKNHKTYDEVDREAALFEQRLGRAPNKALLNHEKKRKIEIKCIELADLMLEQGYDEEEIKRKVASYREILKEKDPSISRVGKTDDESGKTKAESSHEVAKLNQAQQEKLKSAFGISKDYKPGAAFNNGMGGGSFSSGQPNFGLPGQNHKSTTKAQIGVPNHMLNEKPEAAEGFRSKYDGLESEESSSSSSSSSSDSSSSEDEEEAERRRRKKEKRKSRARKSRIREEERKKKLRKRRASEKQEAEEVKEEAFTPRATPTREQEVLPLHKRRRERGERESEPRTYSENKRCDRPADFPNYAEFAKPSLPRREDRGRQRSGGYDDRAQYRDLYRKEIDYNSHGERLTELQHDHREHRRQARESRDQRGYDDRVVSYKTSEDGYHRYNRERDERGYGHHDDGYGRGQEDHYAAREEPNHGHGSLARARYGYR